MVKRSRVVVRRTKSAAAVAVIVRTGSEALPHKASNHHAQKGAPAHHQRELVRNQKEDQGPKVIVDHVPIVARNHHVPKGNRLVPKARDHAPMAIEVDGAVAEEAVETVAIDPMEDQVPHHRTRPPREHKNLAFGPDRSRAYRLFGATRVPG